MQQASDVLNSPYIEKQFTLKQSGHTGCKHENGTNIETRFSLGLDDKF